MYPPIFVYNFTPQLVLCKPKVFLFVFFWFFYYTLWPLSRCIVQMLGNIQNDVPFYVWTSYFVLFLLISEMIYSYWYVFQINIHFDLLLLVCTCILVSRKKCLVCNLKPLIPHFRFAWFLAIQWKWSSYQWANGQSEIGTGGS